MPSSRPSPQQNEARPFEVYGWCTDGRRRCIVAARSWAEAAHAADEPVAVMKRYGAVSVNEREIAVALVAPGVVFFRPAARVSAPFLRRGLARGGSS